jgi:hypothetical protein
MVPLGFGWSKTISRRRHEIKSAVVLRLTAYDGFSKMTAHAPFAWQGLTFIDIAGASDALVDTSEQGDRE